LSAGCRIPSECKRNGDGLVSRKVSYEPTQPIRQFLRVKPNSELRRLG